MATASSPPSPLDPQRLREDFPILSNPIHGDTRLIYFDNAATTQRPRQVIQAMVDTYEKHFANVHRGIHWLSDPVTDRYEPPPDDIYLYSWLRPHADGWVSAYAPGAPLLAAPSVSPNKIAVCKAKRRTRRNVPAPAKPLR